MPRVAPGYKDDVRRRILKAALEEVNASGMQALRMEDVAARVGISRAALYNYFSDKEALLGAILMGMREEGESVMEGIFEGKSFREALSTVFDVIVLSIEEMPGIEAEFFSIASRTPEIRSSMEHVFEETLTRMAGYIAAAQERGEVLSKGDPFCLAELVMYTLGGLKHAIIFGADTSVLKARWDAMADLLFFTGDASRD